MKTMTCSQLGGQCDQTLRAEDWHGMCHALADHVRAEHPQFAEKAELEYKENPNKWLNEMQPKWDATPES